MTQPTDRDAESFVRSIQESTLSPDGVCGGADRRSRTPAIWRWRRFRGPGVPSADLPVPRHDEASLSFRRSAPHARPNRGSTRPRLIFIVAAIGHLARSSQWWRARWETNGEPTHRWRARTPHSSVGSTGGAPPSASAGPTATPIPTSTPAITAVPIVPVADYRIDRDGDHEARCRGCPGWHQPPMVQAGARRRPVEAGPRCPQLTSAGRDGWSTHPTPRR